MNNEKEYRSSENWQRCYFYRDWAVLIRELPDSEQLAMYQAFTNYAFFGEEPEFSSPYARMAWGMMRSIIAHNKKKYDETCERNHQNGQKGGRPSKNSLGSSETHSVIEEPSGSQSNPLKPDIDIEKEKDIDIEKYIESESERGEGGNSESAKISRIYCNLDPKIAETLRDRYGSTIFRKALLEAFDADISGGELINYIQTFCENMQQSQKENC